MTLTSVTAWIRPNLSNGLDGGLCVAALRAALLLGLAVACSTAHAAEPQCVSGQSLCGEAVPIPRHALVDVDGQGDANRPLRLLALIQSNLNRVAARQPVWPMPADVAADPRVQIVAAYSDFVQDDYPQMDAVLAKVEQTALEFRPEYNGQQPYEWVKRDAAFYANYTAAIHDPSPLVRLYAALRVVDGSVFRMVINGDPFTRKVATAFMQVPAPVNGSWLRLPCRTVVGRVAGFESAAGKLKGLGGPVLDCPVDGAIDYAKDAELVQHPAQFHAHAAPASPHAAAPARATSAAAPAGSREAAIDEMGADPEAARPILEQYARVDAVGKLDYVLFQQAFEPKTPQRDATIRKLQAELRKQAVAAEPAFGTDFPPTPYDGTDRSLLNVIRLVSVSHVGMTDPAFYAIPCSILIARPGLAAATDEFFGSNADNFMPRSGCEWGRGSLPTGFPDEALGAFVDASTQADGNFIANTDGSIIYALEKVQAAMLTQVRVNPRSFLKASVRQLGWVPVKTSPALADGFAYPYQVWGYASLNNYTMSLRMRSLYEAARKPLADYYRRLGLTRPDSELASKRALFAAVFGAYCGGSVPEVSLRKMLLEHAPADDIRQQLKNGNEEASQIAACANDADLDPVLLVAVGDPAAFPMVVQHEPDVDVRNSFGKTALMEAAQFNQLDIVKLLLARHARINATTCGGCDDPLAAPLGDDARTALMYAAANGSLQLIRTLLDAGADPYQADTKGYRAIDYLLGFGPTPPNPRLSASERQEAAGWLF